MLYCNTHLNINYVVLLEHHGMKVLSETSHFGITVGLQEIDSQVY